MELNSQLSGGSGGCRWPLMPALGTGRLQLLKYSETLLCTWGDARGIRMREIARGDVRGMSLDVRGMYAGSA